MVAVHLEGMLSADDVSLVRFVEHVDAADSDARVPAGSRLEFGSHVLGESFRGNQAVGVAPEHASAVHRATASTAMDGGSMIAKVHLYQDEIASHQRRTLHVAAGDAAYVGGCHAEEDVAIESWTEVQVAIDDAVARVLMQVRSLAVARSRM